MQEYKVEITFYDSGLPTRRSFTKECLTLEDLKQAFLKRFGNINDAPNSAAKDKKKVKELTRSATTLEEWVQTVNLETRWSLNIKAIKYRSI